MQVRVWPSTVQVMVAVPGPAGRTTPSAEMVATDVSLTLHVGVEEVPLTCICTDGLSMPLKVKSVWFRDREAEVVPEPEPVPEGARPSLLVAEL